MYSRKLIYGRDSELVAKPLAKLVAERIAIPGTIVGRISESPLNNHSGLSRLKLILKRAVLLLFFCLAFHLGPTFSVVAEQRETLDKQYQLLEKQIWADPASVVRQLEQSDISQASSSQQTQHYLILADALTALVYPDKARGTIEQALALVKEEETPWLYYRVLLSKANILDAQADSKVGLELASQVVEWAKSQQDLSLYVQGLYVRGHINNTLLDYENALIDAHSAYKLAAPVENSFVLDGIENNAAKPNQLTKGHIAGLFALVHEYRQEASESIPYFVEAVNYHRQAGNDLELSIALYGLGRAQKLAGDKIKAEAHLKESLKTSQSIDDQQGVAYAMKELAGLALEANELLKAKSFAESALAIFFPSGNKYMLLDTHKTLSDIELKLRNLDKAFTHVGLAKKQLSGESMKSQAIVLDELEAKILAEKGDYKKAFEISSSTFSQRRKLMNAQYQEKYSRLRSQFELEIKKQENVLLEKALDNQNASLKAEERENKFLFILVTLISGFLIILGFLIFRLIKQKNELKRLAELDDLTQIYNRRKTLELIEYQRELACRHKFPFCVAMFDLDHFKQANDQFGHVVGDEILKRFATLCSQNLRHTDVIGRVGGEEFLVGLPHTTVEAAKALVEKMRVSVAGMPLPKTCGDFKVTVSIGLYAYNHKHTTSELVHIVDQSLYQAKNQGRNQVVLCERAKAS